jgi:hypothetical protein
MDPTIFVGDPIVQMRRRIGRCRRLEENSEQAPLVAAKIRIASARCLVRVDDTGGTLATPA